MQISDAQLNFFRTFGFLVFRQLLALDEVAQMSREFEAAMTIWHDENGKPVDDAYQFAIVMDESAPFSARLMADPRFVGVAEQLLGKPVIGNIVEGNRFVGDTRWHPDNRRPEFSSVKFAIYPDPLTGEAGALRVIPGSHRPPLHGQMAADTQAAFGIPPTEIPAYVFESQPGDILVFQMSLWHTALKGGVHRRQIAITYFEDTGTPESTDNLVQSMHGNHRLIATRQARSPKVLRGEYQPRWFPLYWRQLDTPHHRRWVRRLDELGILETPALTT